MSETASSVVSFAYRGRALGAGGREVSGTIDAADRAAAEQLLGELKVDVTELDVVGRPRRTGVISGAEFAAFNQQLAYLAQAGLPIESGLRLIAQETRNARRAASIRAVADEVERGRPLGEAFGAHRGEFPPLYGRLIDAGVAGHNLPGMLFNLNRHMDLVARLSAALWHALAYPLAVIAALAVLLVFLSWYVVPEFREIFADWGTALPALTVFVLSAAEWAPPVLLGLVAMVLATPVAWRVLRMRWGCRCP